MNVSLQWLWEFLSPVLPPALGALVGLRYVAQQTPRQRFFSWVCSMGAGIYIGAALGEHFGLGVKSIGGLMFVIAMLGSELFGVAIAACRQVSADPVGTFRRWLDAVLGRGGA